MIWLMNGSLIKNGEKREGSCIGISFFRLRKTMEMTLLYLTRIIEILTVLAALHNLSFSRKTRNKKELLLADQPFHGVLPVWVYLRMNTTKKMGKN